MNLTAFMTQYGWDILALAGEHLLLVGVAIGAAIALGVPLGILLARRPALSRYVLGFANIAQTVPSLALFGFLIPLHFNVLGARVLGGIGPRTAIVALVLYALLPIIRGTFTGITSVDPAVREAGSAMGMTDTQLLFKVELPLALKFIIAGIRVATVTTVGTATIAAAIDAGGLGRFIFRGLRMNDNGLILAGALPAALIALAADALLGGVERLAAPGRRRPSWRVGAIAGAIAVTLVAGLILGWRIVGTPVARDHVVVGSKDFTEQLLLGELVAQVLEAKTSLAVERRFDLAGNLAHQALVAGEIDMYVEYTGTGLMAVLKEPPCSDPGTALARVRQAYLQRFGLEWTDPVGFGDTFAILVRGETARKLGLKRVSEVAQWAPNWHAGFGPDFMARPDGYRGFAAAYGLQFMDRPREMDLSLTYRALKDGEVDLVAGNSTDGLIPRYDLVQLEDDRHFFPPYDAVPVVRKALLDRRPEVRQALHLLHNLVSVDDMRELNYEIDGEHRDARGVIAAFLRRKGLR